MINITAYLLVLCKIILHCATLNPILDNCQMLKNTSFSNTANHQPSKCKILLMSKNSNQFKYRQQ